MDKIEINPYDLRAMRKLMKEHGDSETMYLGENENGESVTISIYKDKIVTVTLQRNGWERKNIYYDDGTTEELFSKGER